MSDRQLSPSIATAAWGGCAVLLAAAFVTGAVLSETGLLSFSPPGDYSAPDVMPDKAAALYQSVFTAWAALILTIPAMVMVWVRRQSASLWQVWRLFWTVGLIAFSVHMIWSMLVFFGGDFDRMTTTTRVSAFWPGLVFWVWWIVDVALAWTRAGDRSWIALQRVIVHIAAFVMFTGGSLVQGELLLAKALGAIFVAASLWGGIRWIAKRRST